MELTLEFCDLDFKRLLDRIEQVHFLVNTSFLSRNLLQSSSSSRSRCSTRRPLTTCDSRWVDGVTSESGSSVRNTIGSQFEVLESGGRIVDAEVLICGQAAKSAMMEEEGERGRRTNKDCCLFVVSTRLIDQLVSLAVQSSPRSRRVVVVACRAC